MSYKVFLSHSDKDREIALKIVDAARRIGVEVYTFRNDPRPGESVVQKIERNIRESHGVVVLLTPQGHGSVYVQQEIGFAKSAGKLIIPLRHPLVSRNDLAMLQGVEDITLEPLNFERTMSQLLARLSYLRSDRERGMLVAFITILVFVLAARNE